MRAPPRTLAAYLTAITTLAAASAAALAPATAEAQGKDTTSISIKILRVRALDKIDSLSKADFFSRIKIGDEVYTSDVIQDQDDILPNWTFTSQRLPNGRVPVTIDVFDKDVTKQEPIDINPAAGTRGLSFTVQTDDCRVRGLSGVSRCSTVTMAGGEKKKAEIIFEISTSTKGGGGGSAGTASRGGIAVTIHRITVGNRATTLLSPRYSAQVTLDGGEPQRTSSIETKSTSRPGWTLNGPLKTEVGESTTKVKLELFERATTGTIDINRIAAKRDLDFTITTDKGGRNCRVEGFAQPYKCGTRIIRAGDEPESAEIEFSVSHWSAN